jgi:cytochrome d ubiquinol oxidase subunit II
VAIAPGGWLVNYGKYPWMMAAPVLGLAGAVLTILLSSMRRPGLAFVTSSLAMAGVILTAGFSMFPFIMPSISDPNSSLTLWDAPSSLRTLKVMFWAAVIFVPIILAYTAWVYKVLWGKVTEKEVTEASDVVY